jgi:hypothetical protein
VRVSRKRWSRRDLPMPASPMMRATLALAVARALPSMGQSAELVVTANEGR